MIKYSYLKSRSFVEEYCINKLTTDFCVLWILANGGQYLNVTSTFNAYWFETPL